MYNSNSTFVIGICCSPVPELVVVDVLNELNGNERWSQFYQRTPFIRKCSLLESVCQTDMHCSSKTASGRSHKVHSSLTAQYMIKAKLKLKAESRDSYIVRLTGKPDQQHFTITEVAVDRQEPMVLQR